MEEEKGLEVFELTNGVIRSRRGLLSFKSRNTDTKMGSIDHVNVVGTITNGEGSDFWRVFLDHSDDISLLLWTHSTGDKNVGLGRELEEVFFDSVVSHDLEEGVTSDDSSGILEAFGVDLVLSMLRDLIKYSLFVSGIDEILLHFIGQELA